MDLETAQTIVLEINSDAKPATLNALLDASKGFNEDGDEVYRPFAVAVFTMAANPPNSNAKQLAKGDLIFFDWRDRLYSLLAQQEALDCNLDIDKCWSVEAIRNNIKNPCECPDGNANDTKPRYPGIAAFIV